MDGLKMGLSGNSGGQGNAEKGQSIPELNLK